MHDFLVQDKMDISLYTPPVAEERTLPSNYQAKDFIADALTADTLEKVHALCRHIARSQGYDCFVHGTRVFDFNNKPLMHLMSYSGSKWFNHYLSCGYMTIDPLIQQCSQSIVPVVWRYSDKDPALPKAQLQVLQDARDFNRKNIINIPSRSVTGEFGGIQLSKSGEGALTSSDVASTLPLLCMLGPFIHEAVRGIITKNTTSISSSIYLTSREQEVLKRVAEGKDSYSIARILKISENTVLSHMKKIHKKLNVCSRTHAVAKAIMLGLIKL